MRQLTLTEQKQVQQRADELVEKLRARVASRENGGVSVPGAVVAKLFREMGQYLAFYSIVREA